MRPDLEANEVIERLGLAPLPLEGGYFVETWRSDLLLAGSALPPPDRGSRDAGTAIYYLLTPSTFSAIHRVASDEVFHFYLGDPVEMLMLGPDALSRRATLGADLRGGQIPQHVVARGIWQGMRLVPGGRWALLGTTVSPGFDFADFELGARDELLAAWPAESGLIRALTR